MEFVDANILVYAHDAGAGRKRDLAARLIDRLMTLDDGALSTQVLAEFFVVSTRKIASPITIALAKEIVRDFGDWHVHRPTAADVLRAIEISERNRIHFWDAMIVRSAQAMGASVLWTEDLQADARFGDVRVRNPFA
ncbi:MAG: PIN domain-containing protein [Deltaproteobacteria bacterium]|nr:PIN domain-containing protein [Deltaproteobacteria bacterium]